MARSFEATRLLLLFAFLFAFWENAQVTERRSAKSLMSQICQEWLAATASRVDLTGPRELMGFVKLAHETCAHTKANQNSSVFQRLPSPDARSANLANAAELCALS